MRTRKACPSGWARSSWGKRRSGWLQGGRQWPLGNCEPLGPQPLAQCPLGGDRGDSWSPQCLQVLSLGSGGPWERGEPKAFAVGADDPKFRWEVGGCQFGS